MQSHRPFYRRPKPQAIIVLILGLAFYAFLTFRLGGLRANLLAIIFDAFLLVGGALFMMAFFSQFVLPVRSLTERWLALERLISYLMGSHGPAIFIRNGDVQHRSQEMRRRGPGVILLDTASAAVLRNAVAFTRSVGPGIVFTNRAEYLAGTVDLHIQTQQIGPHTGEDPFAPQGSDEPNEAYDRRQERRWQTSGLTRDGVEVIANIAVTFRLDCEPGDRGTMFGYNPDSVWRAIVSEGIDPDAPRDAIGRRVPWNWLPVYLAGDLWREYLRKFVLNELFEPLDSAKRDEWGRDRQTAFELIEALVLARLTKTKVEDLGETGKFTGGRSESREFEILQKRGIRILSVSIRNLRFPDSVERQLITQWKATWLDRAQKERGQVERKSSRAKLMGEERALLDYANAASNHLGPIVIENADTPELLPDTSQSLELLVRGTLNQSVRDPEIHPQLSAEKTSLVDLIEWIRRN